MRRIIRRETLQPAQLQPSIKAHLEILALASAPDLQSNYVFGGPMPPEMVAENERRAAERTRRRHAIIAKHGVFDEYLEPLHEQEQDLAADLATVRQEIADIEKLQKK